MSCQQASRIIASTPTASPTISTHEDPYVFTDTLSTTPPILFNTQKSRSRVTEAQHNHNNKQLSDGIAPRASTVNRNLPLAQLNSITTTILNAKAQAPLIQTTPISSTNFNATQSQRHQQKQKQPQQYKRTSNVCVVRPQQQKLLSSPTVSTALLPSLYTHTPSLWQTPLLLEASTEKQVTNPPLVSPPPPPSPACFSSSSDVTSSSSATAPSTTVTALVTPLVVPQTAAQPLPPSKFHHTTLAQHLQKVECIKKPKKQVSLLSNSIVVESPKCLTMTKPPPLKSLEEHQDQQENKHSTENDLNEIPVNVIFRKPHLIVNEDAEIAEHSDDLHKSNNIKIISNVKVAIASPPTQLSPTINLNQIPYNKNSLISPTCSNKNVVTTKDLTTLNHKNAAHEIRKSSKDTQQHKTVTGNNKKKIISNNLDLRSVALQPTTSIAPLSILQKCIQTNTIYVSTNATVTSNIIDVEDSKGTRKLSKNCNSVYLPSTNIHNSTTTTKPIYQRRKSGTSGSTFLIPQLVESADCRNSTAVAVVKVTYPQPDASTSKFSHCSLLPYCMQKQWLKMDDVRRQHRSGTHFSLKNGREERIAEQKNILRHQAIQLLSTQSLQKWPLNLARQRILCIDRLLHKYKNHRVELPAKPCKFNTCSNNSLEMCSYCSEHFIPNTEQQIFTTCIAELLNNSHCSETVFDLQHKVQLEPEHERLLTENEQQQYTKCKLLPIAERSIYVDKQQHLIPVNVDQKCPQQRKRPMTSNEAVDIKTVNSSRKRKSNSTPGVNPVGRPQKRCKKQISILGTPPPPLSAVLQRKSSTTSLESIASNSHSSNSQAALYTTTNSASCNTNSPTSLAPPALAPLSNVHSQRMLKLTASADLNNLNSNANLVTGFEFKSNEINQIVAQLSVGVNNNNNNKNKHKNNNHMNFISSNFQTEFITTPSSNFNTNNIAEELLTQDMLNICDNSSAYASSEDTGLGGLSESELMGSHDAEFPDEMPLGDTRLLEEHDLANVLSTLPVDAFNELFTSVRQDECDEMDRALELADKHLKSLQQTIGSESDFLGDFLDVNDDILADTSDICGKMEINSPDTSGIDTSTLLIDSSGGSNSAGIGSIPATVNCLT